MAESYPGNEMLKMLFKDYRNDLVQWASAKLLDANKMKSSLNDPHKRTTTILNVHRLIFSGSFGNKFLPEERSLDNVDVKRSSPNFKLQTLNRLNEVFGACFVKCHHSKDISFISPVSIYTAADPVHVQNEFPWLQQGSLVMPLRYLGGSDVECFIPCAGMDPDTDDIPAWSKEIRLNNIVPDLDPKKCIYPLRSAGEGKLTGYRNFNFVIIPPNQVKKDDFIVCRSQWMQVVTAGEDAFNLGRDNVTFKKP